jgi:diguanylate cyclase (GGDEF)-like protein
LGSYRGRYAYFALAASLALVAVAAFGWSYVSGSSERQIRQIEERSIRSGVLADALSYLNLVENGLQRIVIEPLPDDMQALRTMLARLELIILQLERNLSQRQQQNLMVAKELLGEMQQLKARSELLIRIRTDVEEWFPAQRLMRNKLLPYNQQLQGKLELLMQELKQDQTHPDHKHALRVVAELRHAWLSMISELRLYVANRFGIFSSDYQTAMESRLTNIQYHASGIPQHLSQLEAMAEQQQLGLYDASDIKEIYNLYQAWLQALDELIDTLDNPDWRKDMLFMRDNLSPVISGMRQRLSSLQFDLNLQSARDITQLTEIAKRLSTSILGIAVAGILIILLAYLFIHRNLLKPIAETALALKQEAQGSAEITPPPANLQETRDLVDAFTEMRQQVRNRQLRLDHMAHHDALTQLPNRVLFRDRLNHALEIARRGDSLVGVMFLDLDRFKQINDQYGHLVGDELLKVVAERLRSVVRSSDTVARLSGDEFAILIEGLESREGIMPLLEKALATLERPIHIANQEMRISASIGIALAPFDDDTVENLIRDADTAMYEAKRNGRAGFCFFTGEMTHRAIESMHLEKEVRHGVVTSQFFFHYQPVVDQQGDLRYCEALLRWRHGEKGLLSPDVFLDMLDSTGLISDIMNDLLDQTEAFQRALLQRLGRPVAVSINLSVRLLNDPAFCRGLLERLIAGGFSKGGLVLEITEDILSQELAEADVFLQQVRTLGGQIALDDFGTGQASLSHLRQFPFDLLKVDRVFVHSVDVDPNNASLVEAIVSLAHAFNMPVVAEGVETEAQKAFIDSLGCDYVQGHLIGMPMESEKLLGLIETSNGHIH